jgi:GTP cyclohydrolase II
MYRSEHDINGDPAALAVERAVAELRRGRAVFVTGEAKDVLVAAVETAAPVLFQRFGLLGQGPLVLAVTGERAEALGLSAAGCTCVAMLLPRTADSTSVSDLAGVGMNMLPMVRDGLWLELTTCGRVVAASLALTKQARRLVPAVLAIEMPPSADDGHVLRVSAEDIHRYPQLLNQSLQRVSQARVPLAGRVDCELILFRETREGRDHVAVVIGDLNTVQPIPVRLHSACLTGDLLGSLRCDCGDQLRRAVEFLTAAGGGVLLYLDQEGRGIGLANKLRAYALQDTGLDTLEADQQLGFRTDERSYRVAASMLRDLGIARIRLLTNNPHKIRALREAGIHVTARELLSAPLNPYNERYIRTKIERAGHLPGRVRCPEDA